MDQDNITRIKDAIAVVLNTDTTDCTEETHLFNDLEMSSVDFVETIMEVEDTFDIEITDGDAENIKTIGDLEMIVRRNLMEEE